MEAAKSKILLCEDDTNLGMVLKNYLELNDYDVTLERDGRLGLAAFQRDRFATSATGRPRWTSLPCFDPQSVLVFRVSHISP